MQIERIAYEPDARGATPPYSKLVRTSAGLVFVAGQVGMDASGAPVPGGIVAETHQMFDNLSKALAAADLGLQDVIKATVWLTEADEFSAFNAIYRTYFDGNLPARACVQSGLMGPFRVEIDVIAAAR
jgi:2-iminobutanoate/2-iminopropanoate deaminase